jgi:hypothetical protein
MTKTVLESHHRSLWADPGPGGTDGRTDIMGLDAEKGGRSGCWAGTPGTDELSVDPVLLACPVYESQALVQKG